VEEGTVQEIALKGPVKGFYALDSASGITDFGLRLDDPCQAILKEFPL
jgi:hypothetical protein